MMRGWSPEEDELLLQLIQTSGKRWKLIAEALGKHVGAITPRTPAMVRNRYLRIERGRWLTERGMSKNRCGQCGQLKRGHVCQAPRALVNTSFEAQEARHEAARLRYGESLLLQLPGTSGVGSPVDATVTVGAPLAPPSLRTQDSMEILAMASETHLQAMIFDDHHDGPGNKEAQEVNGQEAMLAHTASVSTAAEQGGSGWADGSEPIIPQAGDAAAGGLSNACKLESCGVDGLPEASASGASDAISQSSAVSVEVS